MEAPYVIVQTKEMNILNPLLELESAVKKVIDGKASGLDNIPGERLKYSGSFSSVICITKIGLKVKGKDWKRQEFVKVF